MIIFVGRIQWSLGWIRDTKQEFKTFVQNRLIKIRENVSPKKWNYVPTNENPADIITRFNNKELYVNHVWLNGPRSWREPFSNSKGYDEDKEKVIGANPFKYQFKGEEFDEKMLEANKEEIITLLIEAQVTPINADILNLIDINRYSNVKKLNRVTSWIFTIYKEHAIEGR